MKSLLLLLALSPFLACQEYGIVEDPDNINAIKDGLVPDILVSPLSIDFGRIDAENSLTEIVTIQNMGKGDLHIVGIELDSHDSVYDVGTVGSILLPPGDITSFVVTFDPVTAAQENNNIFVDSDDPDEPTVTIQLLGEGIAPIIDVSPVEYDFGQMYIGCNDSLPLVISNIGNADLEVTEFSFNTAGDLYFDYDMPSNGQLPWIISPNSSVEVWVDYFPLDEFSDTSYLTSRSSDLATPTNLTIQYGTGLEYGNNRDLFEQPINGSTDILFGLDWSCSMYGDIANVQANFNAFITTLASMDSDYHVAVVVEDSGCVLGGDTYIDNSMTESEQQAIFTTMIGTSANQGSNTERIFSLFESALSSTNRGNNGCNGGFYRDDAKLNLIAVSDEPEQSSNPYTYYTSLFQSLKQDTDDLAMHAIAADNPSNGSSSCGASYNSRYEDATTHTSGIYLSICATDWGSHLETLAENASQDLSSFELTGAPVPETIEVMVDGITTITSWQYNSID
ncbi:MAG: choice-of-anchor D domain-containing protein, partial [Candidatus Poseidoniales archaeon]|nr:choice-of-anchor D domain-containing protein [Candidatus Poseidoniales archaeon]